MSRLPASALEEGDQIHAILRPLLAEVGAAKRRATALTAKPEPRPLPYAELDLAIDALLLRMRVDPRPPKTKTGIAAKATGTLQKPVVPSTRESQRPKVQTDPSMPPVPEPGLPPPVPLRGDAPPPVPAGGVARPPTKRNLERPTPPVPVQQPPDALAPRMPPVPTAPMAPQQQQAPKKAAPPVYGPDEVSGPIVFARPGNAPETFLLYDDIVMLSSMNDRDGLLISLERLLILAKLEDHVRVFIDANEPKLVGLYEAQLKSFSKVPRRKMPAIDNTMPRVFLRGEKIAAVLAVIDGKATVSEIVQKVTTFTRIETLSCLAQMQRAGMIDV